MSWMPRAALPGAPRRILIGAWGSYGDLNPAVGLALGLQARGHDVTLATLPAYRDQVQQERLGFVPVGPDLDPGDRALAARIMDARRGTEFLFRKVILPGVRQTAADLRDHVAAADLVISHPVTFALPALCEALGRPWASYVLAPMSFFSAGDAPVLPPAPWLRPIAARSPWLSRRLVGIARFVTRTWTPEVAALRSELGLPPGANPVFEGQHSPTLVLALFSSCLASPQADWPAGVQVTGAIPYNGPRDTPLDSGLEAFLATGPPPVVFTLGTSAVAAAGPFYDESVKAVRALGRRAVLLVGHYPENQPSVPLPDDVLVTAFAPHAQLFPRAAAIVHQGGAGTLHQALASGRPMLVVPHAHDQPDNADRARRLGVARIVSPRRYRAGRVAAILGDLLTSPSHAEAAARVGAVVRAEDGVAAACDAIERTYFG
jgi:rhamnosyltransferase subunit B